MVHDPSHHAATDSTPDLEFRRECYRCFRAASVCICDQISQIRNRTGVIILQHHREVLHPIGTARIARLGLENATVEIARRSTGLATDFQLPPNTGLLYPRPDAIELEPAYPGELPDNLLVLDGTWSQAHSMYRANPWLRELPHFVLKPEIQSNYRIRRQPAKDCLSTIEALVQALKIIEPETKGLDELLRVFDDMVDQQLAHRNHLNAKSQVVQS